MPATSRAGATCCAPGTPSLMAEARCCPQGAQVWGETRPRPQGDPVSQEKHPYFGNLC